MISIRTRSADETRAIGERLGTLVAPGDVLTLTGAFGAGKTTLVQGLARGLGVTEPVTSPSFGLIGEYQGRLSLYHLDLYRLRSTEEVLDLGVEDLLDGAAVVAIEWPEPALVLLPVDRLDMRLEVLGDERELRLDAGGDRASTLLRSLS